MLIYWVDGDVVEKKKGTHEEKKQQQPFKSPYSSRTYVVCSLGIGNKVDLMQKRTITCSGSICLYFPLPLARSLVLSAESLNINILTYTRARSKIMKLKCKPSNCVWTLKYEVCECVSSPSGERERSRCVCVCTLCCWGWKARETEYVCKHLRYSYSRISCGYMRIAHTAILIARVIWAQLSSEKS